MGTEVSFIIMGVCGSGKTTVGRKLADALGIRFLDADDIHSPENKKKMGAGIPLTDEDRYPWLASLREIMREHRVSGRRLVLACSALKREYRDILTEGDDRARFIYLKGTPELFRKRMKERRGHYMKESMLASQFETLEEPENALIADASLSPDAIVSFILKETRNLG